RAPSPLLAVPSSLGWPGLALSAVVLGLPLGACVWARLRAPSRAERLLAAGIGGSLGYFAAHGQVDWIWQLSSCALPATLLAAVAVGMLPPGRERRRSAITRAVALGSAFLAAGPPL